MTFENRTASRICERPAGHAGVHRVTFRGIKYEWPDQDHREGVKK